jgi:DNA polymerase III alpha subunit
VLVADAHSHGVELLPPDVNRSGVHCTMEGQAVRIGLSWVKGLTEKSAGALVTERQRNGEFTSLPDFLSRTV